MKKLHTLFKKPVENKTVVEEEKRGYGAEFLITHRTFINNPEVRRHIMNMSYDSVIS
jgi:hypothetical protein